MNELQIAVSQSATSLNDAADRVRRDQLTCRMIGRDTFNHDITLAMLAELRAVVRKYEDLARTDR